MLISVEEKLCYQKNLYQLILTGVSALTLTQASAALPQNLLVPPVNVPVPGDYMAFNVKAFEHSSALGNGYDTGMIFDAGDSISGFVDTDDLWNAGALPRWSNADGLVKDLYATGSDDSAQSTGTHIGKDFGQFTMHGFSAPFGALVGNIGSSYFLLGTTFDVLAPTNGLLKLFYWDSSYSDNSEYITVSIEKSVSAVPVPAAAWLFGSSLIGLMGLRKKAA